MTLRSRASLTEEPEASVVRWRVLEVNDSTRHFIGVDDRHLGGRVCSAVVAFDNLTWRGPTRSERIYRLIGDLGRSGNGDYVWQEWCAVNEPHSFAGITEWLSAGVTHDNRQ